MTHEDLSKQQIEEAKQTGKCPECGRPMKKLTTSKGNKNEWYCEDDHLSVPLFNS